MDRRTTIILSLAVLILAVVPLGVTALVLGFVMGDSPCILCWAQRIGMGLIALLGAFILRYGPRPRYIGMGVLVGAFGLYMALRHSAAHFQRDIGQGFSLEIMGAHTYAWSLLIFWICVLVMGALLLTLEEDAMYGGLREIGTLGRIAIGTLFAMLAVNAVQAFITAGPPPFVGPGDPVRFSWNPKHWAWTLEEWSGGGPTLRGAWSIDKPRLAALNQDPTAGPFYGLPMLAIKNRFQLPAQLAAPTDLAWDGATRRFLVVTERHQVALLSEDARRLLRWTRVDPGYSIDLGQGFVGAAFHAKGFLAMAENKSWVALQEAPEGADENWRGFLENRSAFLERGRGRFTTVRARQSYVSALTTGSQGLYTAAVPNPKRPSLIISRFDGRDRVLSEEFEPTIAPGGPELLRGRTLADLAPVGLAVDGDKLLLVSGAYRTLVEIDLARRQILRAWSLPAMSRPTGLALRDADLLVLGADGQVSVLVRP